MGIIPDDQLKIHIPRSRFDLTQRGGQHVGTSRELCLEHEISGVKIILPTSRGQHFARDVAVAAMEYILTHPDFKG